MFTVLTERMVEQGRLAAEKRADLTDVLFALTGMPFYAALVLGRRSGEGVKALVSGLAGAAIASGQSK